MFSTSHGGAAKHGTETTAECVVGFYFFYRAFPTFSGPFGLEKCYNQRVSVIKAVGDISSTTAYPKRKGKMDFFFFSLDIINPWLFWAISCSGEQGEWGLFIPRASISPTPWGALCHRKVQPLGHSGGSFHLARVPEPWRIFQGMTLEKKMPGLD